MRSLPHKALVFLIAMYLLGIAAAVCAIIIRFPQAHANWWEISLFIVLAALAGGKKITLMRHRGAEDVGSMSLGFTITYAAMLYFGPAGGVLIGCISCLSGCVYPKRQRAYQLCFNVALAAVEALLAGAIFLRLNYGALHLDPLESFPAIVASCLTYYAVNTGSVATIIALCTGERIGPLWRQTFLWTAPSYFAGASVGALGMVIFGDHVATALLFASPVAYLTYQSYAVYMGRAEEKQRHIEDLQKSKEDLTSLYKKTIESLALAIDAKDAYTHRHIKRVQRYAMATAQKMGVSGTDLDGVETGALLHDIGKLGVPEYVLLKPGVLTAEEFAKIRKHPETGAAILDPVRFPWPVQEVVRYHHERWDGTGYPEGLKGEAIPLTARILAVADVYDALTSTRSYRHAWPHERAMASIKEAAGSHFDPRVVDAFCEVIDQVVAEMAAEGSGPLVIKSPVATTPSTSAADEAVRDIQRASSELWALYEVAQTLSSSLGLQETLEILARKLDAILPGTACVFLLEDERSSALVARAIVGVNREFFEAASTASNGSRSRLVARNRETYLGEYDPEDLLLTSHPSAQWVPLHSALIVPIVHQGEVLGTINLYHPQPDAFAQHDRQLLETIAERTAMALYNGVLFDRTRSHAITDPLTGLYNVRYLTQYVEQRCARSAEIRESGKAGPAVILAPTLARDPENLTPQQLCLVCDAFALLCLDVDSFKPINDNFGHQKGDQVLRDLSRIFRSTAKETDVVARYGGDEFLIVLDGAGQQEAAEMAAHLKAAVEGYEAGLVHPRLGALQIGVSIGYACYPEDGEDCATLLSAADRRMYNDKTERKLGRLAQRSAARDEDPDEDDRRQLPFAA